MLKIYNYKVYDLVPSILSCRNSMKIEPSDDYGEYEKALDRAKKLVKCGHSSGEANFLCGIRVSFDVTYPQYWSIEAERYHFLDIVCSSSKMHRLCKMDLNKACNEYVLPGNIYALDNLIKVYNETPTQENWMRVISNCPMGLELFMRCTTNYLQLANIYKQRRHHKLQDWQVFCDWIENKLPLAHELIIGDK